MSLVPPQLDDRQFDDLRTEALQRVRLSCPEWTDFNVSDPGITLVELFAWFTELMLYRMNQVPDKLHGELLSLVGIQPEPAKPAQALIEFIPPDNNCPRIVARLTESAPIAATVPSIRGSSAGRKPSWGRIRSEASTSVAP